MNTSQHNYMEFLKLILNLDGVSMGDSSHTQIMQYTRLSVEGDYVDIQDAISLGKRLHEDGKNN
ncbi:MAG: hypothetical protein ACXAEN_24250 [Candidatus Thorarchaeota archaeon]|jgi:hypothetical protein